MTRGTHALGSCFSTTNPPSFHHCSVYAPLSLPLTQSLYPEQSSQNSPSPNTHPQLTSGFRTAAGDQEGTGDANKNRVWTGWTSLPTVSQGLAQTVASPAERPGEVGSVRPFSRERK